MAAQARLSLHMSKYHIVGNHMWQLISLLAFIAIFIIVFCFTFVSAYNVLYIVSLNHNIDF